MRVLEIMGSLHRGGAETMIMNYYRAFDKQLCQMDFVIHARFADDYCVEAENMGAHIIELERPGHIGAIRYIKSLRNAILENGPYGQYILGKPANGIGNRAIYQPATS